ncbi:MAG: hypothetical protein PVF32_06520, partial [Desulfobacterales bacterium]
NPNVANVGRFHYLRFPENGVRKYIFSRNFILLYYICHVIYATKGEPNQKKRSSSLGDQIIYSEVVTILHCIGSLQLMTQSS